MNLKFPARYTFSVVRNTQTGEQKVTASETGNQKIMLTNIKYKDIKHFSWESNEKVALLGVKEIVSEEDLKSAFKDYAHWEVKKKCNN